MPPGRENPPKETNTQNIGWFDVGPQYRSLVICNYDFPGTSADLQGVSVDADNMTGLMTRINGGRYKANLAVKRNMKSVSVADEIARNCSGNGASDVTLFYISSHANSDGDVRFSDDVRISWKTLASCLNQANPDNQVIVFIDACHSGAAVAKNGEAFDPEAAARGIVSAFAAADPGITLTTRVRDENGVEKRGELRTSKFVVFASCAEEELSTAYTKSGSVFTQAVIIALTASGSHLAADADKDGYVSAAELFSHVYKTVTTWSADHPDNDRMTPVG